MYVGFDADGYVDVISSTLINGCSPDLIDIPDDFDYDHMTCYHMVKGKLVIDTQKVAEWDAEQAAYAQKQESFAQSGLIALGQIMEAAITEVFDTVSGKTHVGHENEDTEKTPSILSPEQHERAERLHDERELMIAQINDVTQTLETTLQQAREGLVPVPKPGEAWDAKKNYIEGDTAKEGGVLYVANRYSKGKKPSENKEYWSVAPTVETYPDWGGFAEMHQFKEGDRVSCDGKNWECIDPCTKTNMFKPKAGSAKWKEI